MNEIENLVTVLGETQTYFKTQAQKQVNINLTLRNWFFGFYIVEYEQKGKDKAVYGEKLYKEIASRCKHIKGMSKSNLYLYKDFYLMYSNIFQTLSGKLYLNDFQQNTILQTVTGKLIVKLVCSNPLNFMFLLIVFKFLKKLAKA